MINILYDCDPGQDDAMALLTALGNSREISILGVTTVGGNQNIDLTTKNAGHLLKFCNQKIPLVKGQSRPLVRDLVPQPHAHGFTGMDGANLSQYKYPLTSENVVTFMAQILSKATKKVTIVATAPLTNIALLIKTYPELVRKIAKISLMGGGINHGNVTPLAEFNIWTDPEAAQIVFNSNLPIIMAGLDVTEKATLTKDEINSLHDKGKVSELAFKLLSFYQRSGEKFGFIDSPIHDLVAMEYVLHPEIFSGFKAKINIITETGPALGLTYIQPCKDIEKNVLVLNQVNRIEFKRVLFKALETLDKNIFD